jgi:hypothetical protein
MLITVTRPHPISIPDGRYTRQRRSMQRPWSQRPHMATDTGIGAATGMDGDKSP